MLNLEFSHNLNVESAYIITVKGNAVSEEMAKACEASCINVKMPVKIWDAYDGTKGTLVPPKHLINKPYMTWFKQLDPQLSLTEVACALSHISLWCHCIEIDSPIVILEHDAVMVKPFLYHHQYNSIIYLGCSEQFHKKFEIHPTPLFGTESNNYHFILRTHAYSIDPCIAKNLVSYVLKYGIHESADHLLRADLFPITMTQIYAYDRPNIEKTTITGRKKTIDGRDR